MKFGTNIGPVVKFTYAKCHALSEKNNFFVCSLIQCRCKHEHRRCCSFHLSEFCSFLKCSFIILLIITVHCHCSLLILLIITVHCHCSLLILLSEFTALHCSLASNMCYSQHLSGNALGTRCSVLCKLRHVV